MAWSGRGDRSGGREVFEERRRAKVIFIQRMQAIHVVPTTDILINI